MPWNESYYPPAMSHLHPLVRAKAIEIANALLAEEGTSLERFIVSRRLQRCHQTLSDPAQAHRTVSDIAYSYGFSDPSHFTRRFKAQFGFLPSEYRSQKT